MTQERGDSYPKLRDVLGEEAFAELAHLIRKTYEANEERRRRRGGDSGYWQNGAIWIESERAARRRPGHPHEVLMRRALDLARQARDHGNHPFGALLADADGRVRLEAENTVVTGRDCTGHAETNLMRLACPNLDRDALAAATLYASTEPCAMCAGAIYWSGVSQVVFGLREGELRALTGDDPKNPTLALPCREVFARGQRPIVVIGPLLEDEARDVHEGYWRAPG